MADSQDSALLLALKNLTLAQNYEQIKKATDDILNILSPDMTLESGTENTSANLQYCLKRLIRGSASLNENTRLAFISALGALLGKFKDILEPSQLLKLHEELITASDLFGSASPSRSEMTGILAAQLGFYAALKRSFELSSLQKDDVEVIVSNIFKGIKSRSFLRIPAYTLLLDLIKFEAFEKSILIQLKAQKQIDIDLIWFVLSANLNEVDIPALKDDSISTPLLSNTTFLVPSLLESMSYLNDPHPIWFQIIRYENENCSLAQFLDETVDRLLISSSSVQKRTLGLTLIDFCLENQYKLCGSLTSFVNLIDALGQKSVMKSKGALPLNIALKKTILLMAKNANLISESVIIKFVGLPNFRLLPRDFVTGILEDSKTSNFYWNLLIERFKNADFSVAFKNFDAIIDAALLKASHTHNEEVFKLSFDFLGRLSDSNLDIASSRFYSFLHELTKTSSPIDVFKLVTGAARQNCLIEDEIVSDALKRIKKARKLMDKVSDQGNLKFVLQSIDLCFYYFELNLFIQPAKFVNLVEDLYECLKRLVNEKRSRKDSPNPLNVYLDMLLEILSSGSALSKDVADACFKLVIPNMDLSLCDQIFKVLDTSDKSETDEIFEDLNSDDNDEDDEEAEEEENFNNFNSLTESSIPAKRQVDETDENSEDDEPEIFLDQADEQELALFDSKLSEIFKHKKVAKNSQKLSKRALSEFKYRVLGWIRILFAAEASISPELSITVRVRLLGSLTTIQQSSQNDNKSHLLNSISETLSTSFKKDIQLSDKDVLASLDEAFIKLVEDGYENKILWSSYANLVRYLLRLLEKEVADRYLLDFLTRCWNLTLINKKILKSSFHSFFALWHSWNPLLFQRFVFSLNFFSDIANVNSHFRLTMLAIFKTMIKQSSCTNFPEKVFIDLVDFFKISLTQGQTNSVVVKETILIFSTCARKFSPELRSTHIEGLEVLVQNAPKSMQSLINGAIENIRKCKA